MEEEGTTVKVEVDSKTLHRISDLLTQKDEDFLKHFDGKDFGYLCSMSNMVDAMYYDATKAKDSLLKIMQGKSGEEAEKIKKTVDMLYDNLFLLEHKFELLKELKEKRKLD